MSDPKESYEIGYKKPPRRSQFKPGESGNRKGRPKGGKNFITVIEQELNSLIEISENGKRRKISKREAIAKQTVNKAVVGDHRSTSLLLNETRAHEELSSQNAITESLTQQEDSMVMESILQRIQQIRQPSVHVSTVENVDDFCI
jgi:hypothetical protein